MEYGIQVSVLMPVYNGEKFLHETIRGILNQTYKDFEFVIINDASTDSSEQLILSYSDPRIRYFKNEKNLGIVGTRNVGLSLVQGKYVAMHDQDDLSDPKRFELQVHYLESNEDVGLCGSNFVSFSHNKTYQESILPETHDEICTYFLFGNPIVQPSTMMRRSVLEQHNLRYIEGTDSSEDIVLFINLYNKTRFVNLQKPLFRYRLHDNNVSKTSADKQKCIGDQKRKEFIETFFSGCDNVQQLMDRHISICNKGIVSKTDLADFFAWLKFLESVNIQTRRFETFLFRKGLSHYMYRKFIKDQQVNSKVLFLWIFKHFATYWPLPTKYKLFFFIRIVKDSLISRKLTV